MNEFEKRRVAFQTIKPKYRWAIRGIIFCLSMCSMLILCLVNLGLVLIFGINPDEPFKDQTISLLWPVIFIMQIAMVVPLINIGGWRVIARFIGKRKKWSEEKIDGVASRCKYPEEWAA